ncbi:class I tRNA ligase family protein [Streptomyces sp. NBC_00083]|uniref:class I tRNA ligase family protein n=1 Tax=Streptomyces sp. NBC_00083 TaxID=2975647 RepID=UPI002255CEA1|nr:class I tRNA ligase family protein [Streptomyces sp. NBC_00083]MCX5386207.1 class I tRNA ligase family protein [Streptomyces sp. NBC_00083]
MNVSVFSTEELHQAFGIEMSSVEKMGAGAGWGRVAPGVTSDPHQHDEIEMFVVVAGTGWVAFDGRRVRVEPGTVCQFEPFETHVIENDGDVDLVFFDLYWRDPARAAESAAAGGTRRRFHERPVFVFSTPPTPNGDLHLGHLSGPYLGADAYVRFQRMRGTQAWHLTGSDDFQSYVVDRARREERDPARTAEHYSAEIAATLRLMDIEVDQYTVTNQDPDYREGLRGYFSKLVGSGAVTVQETAALVDAETDAYLYEVDVAGGCPGCGGATSGNICEECGEPNTCADLADPRSGRSDAPPEQRRLPRFVLPLHEFGGEVADHHRLGRVPARLRALAERVFARGRLDIPVTHPSDWGVPPAESGAAGQVIWVWPEMSYGFLHGIEALGGRLGRTWQAAAPEQDWKFVHFFGYDNSFYHAVLYPALYRLAHPRWNPDIDYHVNEFYLLEGGKFSTSRRHAIWGKQILRPETVDAVRYHLALTRPEERRTNFELAAYTETVQRVLVDGWQGWLNDLGARVAGQYGGTAPDAGVWTPEHTAFLNRLGIRLAALADSYGQDGFSLNRAAAELDGIVADTRRFAEAEARTAQLAGWKDEARTAVALELAAAQLLARAAVPVMPRFAARLAEALGKADLASWPAQVELVTPGTRIDLEQQSYFAALPSDWPPAGGVQA